MHYIINLPVHVRKDFIYSSSIPIREGCRVAVLFNRRELIGICGSEVNKPPSGIKYSSVLEILDTEPVLPADLRGSWFLEIPDGLRSY